MINGGYEWHPIIDLPDDSSDLAQDELRTLSSIWEEQKHEIQELDAVQAFNEKLLRRWAIETGIIERVYSLDRGITETLIERGLHANLVPHDATDKDPEWVVQVIQDQYEAVNGLFDFVTNRRELSVSYINELHAVLTANQHTTEALDHQGNLVEVELRKGEFKQYPNNPTRPNGSVHEYCPPEQVDSEMDRLVEMHKEHVRDGVAPEVEAAWLHHRFTQIHPFQDGNGRVARALATLVFLRAGWFPLVVTNDHREEYIDALEEADNSNLNPLVKLFTRLEKQAFIGALSVAEEVREHDRHIHQVIQSIRDSFRKRRETLREDWGQAKEIARNLHDEAFRRFERVANELRNEVEPEVPPGTEFACFADEERDGGDRSHWFHYQIVETAKQLDYYANTSIYHSWVRLGVETPSRAEILVSFHGIGHEFRGILVASATFFRREVTEEGERDIVDVTPLTDELFQINYRESADTARSRFEGWLDPAVVTGLEMVRRRI